jgi:putative membrane protein
MKFILRWIVIAVALYAAIAILPGIEYQGNWLGIFLIALIFGFVNALLRPLLKLLTCPLIILTLGLFTLVINTVMFAISTWVSNNWFGLALTIADPFWWNAFLGALIVSAISIFLNLILKDERRQHHKRD